MSQPKTWTVVKFTDDHSVAAVPTIWIYNDKCLWPPFSTEKVNLAIKNQELDTCWPSHPITAFRNATYDSYEIARQKEKIAEETSDLNTDVEEGHSRRKFSRKKKYPVEITDSNSESEVEIFTPKTYKQIKPKMPTLKTATNISFHHYTEGDQANSDVGTFSLKPRGAKPKTVPSLQTVTKDISDSNIYSDGAASDVETHPLKCRGVKPKTIPPLEPVITVCTTEQTSDLAGDAPSKTYSNPPSRTTSKSSNCSCQCPHHAELNKEILRQLYFLRSISTELMAEVKSTKALKITEEAVGESLLNQFSLPISSREGLQQMDDFLKIEENFKKIESELYKFGGNNLLDFIKRCMGILFAPQFAMNFSWLGRRTKEPFKNYLISKVIINAALKSGKCSNLKDAEQEIARWLRRAPDRANKKN